MGRPDRWVVCGSGFFTAFRMTEGRAASVILRSQATKNSKALCDCCVYILTNETHSLHMESENPMWVDLSADRSPIYRVPGGLTRTVMMSVSWYR